VTSAPAQRLPPIPWRPAEAVEPELLTVVGALIGQAHSVLSTMSGVWDAAAAVLRRQLVIVGAGFELHARAADALASLGEVRNGGSDSGAWGDADVVVLGGAGPWRAPAVGRAAPRARGPVRVAAMTGQSSAIPDGAPPGELDPVASFAPDDIPGLVHWLVDDAQRWSGAARAGAALDVMEGGLGPGTGPAGEDLSARMELVRLAHPVLHDVTILRAEAEGSLRLTGTQRRELRRVLMPSPPAVRVGLAASADPAEIREVAGARAGHWRQLINDGRVPFGSRFAADAVTRAYDRLATSP